MNPIMIFFAIVLIVSGLTSAYKDAKDNKDVKQIQHEETEEIDQ